MCHCCLSSANVVRQRLLSYQRMFPRASIVRSHCRDGSGTTYFLHLSQRKNRTKTGRTENDVKSKFSTSQAGAGLSETKEVPGDAEFATFRGFTPVGRSNPGHPSYYETLSCPDRRVVLIGHLCLSVLICGSNHLQKLFYETFFFRCSGRSHW